MSNVRETLQDNLIFYSKVKGVSQKDMAIALGVSQAAVSHWFKGDNSPNIEIVAKIADILGIRISDLLNERENEKTPTSEEPEAGAITLEESNALLVSLGYIQPGEDLSDRDLKFLSGVIEILDSWFAERAQRSEDLSGMSGGVK